MPCDDITEIIELQLSDDDRLASYTLNKRTCGADIGQASLLLDLVGRRPVDDVLSLSGQAVRDHYPRMHPDEEFLYYKHLTALQEALAVLSGRAAGGPGAACSALAVWPDEAGLGVNFRGLITVEALTDNITACGNCGSCGTHRNPGDASPS